MRRTVILASVFVATTAFAQVHGVPASVTSPRSNGQFMVPTGVPASVTSLGPQGFTPGINPLVPVTGPVINPLVPAPAHPIHRNGRRHDGRNHVVTPIYYGYPVYYTDSTYGYQMQSEPEPVVEQPAPPQRLEIVVVDKRDEEKKKAEQEAELQQAAEPKKSDLTAASGDPAIFVFKDGTRKELANFAVMAGNLYDLSDGKMFKIAMNTIDREATLAANAQQGRAIQLP
jgi:hypothetical protein